MKKSAGHLYGFPGCSKQASVFSEIPKKMKQKIRCVISHIYSEFLNKKGAYTGNSLQTSKC